MITKEQWSEIEKTLQGLLARAEFKLGEDKISVERRQVKEGKYELVVFFNGEIKGAWSHDPESENYQPLIEKFWRKATRSLYSPKAVAEAAKRMGKRRAKDFIERHNKKIICYLPFWPKAKTLVNHFKKIKDLEFVDKSGVSGF
jgi:hypothetical protein